MPIRIPRALIAIVLLSALSGTPAAQAADVILMVNMNYSVAELKAAKEVAAKRGQRVVMVPPENTIERAEALFRLRDGLEKKVRQQKKGLSDGQVRAFVSDFMLKGTASRRDPELTAALAPEIENIHRETLAVHEAEEERGTMAEQLEAKAAELFKAGHRVDSMIMSSHSDGSNLSGETSLRLSSSDISRLASSQPRLFSDPRHVLLLGCYNMTETNHLRWRGDLFRNATLIGGFGVRAPSRFQPVSAQYVKQVLNKADELDGELTANNSPLNPALVSKAFRGLAAVSNTQSVLDYCSTIVEGQPGARRPDCGEQWDVFMRKADVFAKEYLSLKNPVSDPPQNDQDSPLLAFYNEVHALCPAEKAERIPRDEVAGAERYRTYIREAIVRLRYWWSLQKNFQTYFEDQIDRLSPALENLGAPSAPSLDGDTGRVEFLNWYNEVEKTFKKERSAILAERIAAVRTGSVTSRTSREFDRREAQLKATSEQFRRVYGVLYNLKGEDGSSDKPADDSSVEATLSRGSIPFNWLHEGAATLPRSRR